MVEKRCLDLLEFIPDKIICNGGNGQEVILNKMADNEFISISYFVDKVNQAKQEFSITIPRFISKSKETFDVFGLLQAEKGKLITGVYLLLIMNIKLSIKLLNGLKKNCN